jgi:hypothetical protein
MRRSMIGTTIMAPARCLATLANACCGSNSRRNTSVEPSTIANIAWLKPSE